MIMMMMILLKMMIIVMIVIVVMMITIMMTGPAVLNGGFTTFLALVLCYFSTGHVLLTFFKG